MADIKIAQLLKAGVHFGHKTPRWNEDVSIYLYGT
jgi:ribosomal protein S2